ncbi:MAG: 50S ribosomal protein L10 [Patescibacteria group bacterium]|nr:50S ribosomal protein L10 [Patescibacteria group bacterium]
MKKRERKQKVIEILKKYFSEFDTIFFINLRNIKVDTLLNFKRDLKNLQSFIKVAKKNLIIIANSQLKSLLSQEIFKVPLGVIFSNKIYDLSVINLLNKYKKDKNIEILGAYLNNQFYQTEELLPLSKYSHKDMIYSQLVFVLKNNLNKLVFDLKSPLIKLKTVVNNIKK